MCNWTDNPEVMKDKERQKLSWIAGVEGDMKTKRNAWSYTGSVTLAGQTEQFKWGLFLSSVQFSRSVMSDSWRPNGLQHTRPPCPSPTPRAYSNSCPSHQWCHPTISSFVVPFSSCLQSFPAARSFPMSQFFASIRWPKYWSFSFSVSPSNEYSGLISFRMDWLDLLVVQGTLLFASSQFIVMICVWKCISDYSFKELLFNPFKNIIKGLPWWLSGKESACQCRRHDPWSREIPRAEEQLIVCTTNYGAHTLEPANCSYWAHMLQLLKSMCPRVCVPQEKPPPWEARTLLLESSPCLPQPERSPHNTEDPAQAINKCTNKNILKIKYHKKGKYIFKKTLHHSLFISILFSFYQTGDAGFMHHHSYDIQLGFSTFYLILFCKMAPYFYILSF